MSVRPFRSLSSIKEWHPANLDSGSRFWLELQKPRTPHAECDFLLRDAGGRDCTPPDTGRCFLWLPSSCDTPKSRLPPPSSCDGTVRCSCCLPDDGKPSGGA